MKRALIVIASVSFLAMTVAMESANAQITMPAPAKPLGVPRTAPLNPNLGPRTAPLNPNLGPRTAPLNPNLGPRTAPLNPDLGAPRTAPLFNPDSPAATGGGSIGYNQFWKWKWW
jgi:hypothetical protein